MLRVAVLGISTEQPCGVRDHAGRLARALEEEGVSCSIHWLSREQRALEPARSELRRWTRALQGELAERPPDAVLLHYSVFPYSYRGLPLFARPVLAAAGAGGAPVVTMLHEFVYPWGRSGARGALWATAQRAALVGVVRASRSLVVTADFRAQWLASRRWLPRREVAVAPVFSNLPVAAPQADGAQRLPEPGTIGLFGFAAEGTAAALVLDALRLLRERGSAAKLRLLGAPGRSSPAGDQWHAAAEARGLLDSLSFSGMLPAQELADRLAACELLLFADPPGPTPRKTTLAASLASGTPVVALDGPRTWPELAQAEAALILPPSASALADGLQRLLGDAHERSQLGARGSAFAQRHMSVQQSARVLAAALAAAAR
ncbi:MAG TPA: glycosyltransferase family 4 protein [Solirubrobacteraceae bacterium]|jgi:glycosyltransferase involved in cell wall biosynthesis|nr:glycosyltransferase family 4 protein [Solirubrobacteraceae bacterium]